MQIGSTSAPTLTFADSGLIGSSSYSYRVRAKDASAQTGAYSNTATVTTAAAVPGAPTNLAATSASGSQINLSWGPASEAGGTIAQYLIERCQGAGCSSFTQIATTAAVTYADTGLTAATSYSYRVRAKDSVGTNGPYSNVATTATAAPTITAPGTLAASAAGPGQISLSWTAATETGGSVSQYLIERCQGAGCSNFAQIGTTAAAATAFTDTGLSASTAYSYRVRARDAAGTTGPYSNVASATTAAPTLTAPGALTASAASTSQINLSWTAATETGGSVSQYLIERCQGAGCNTFVQIGTAAAPATTYSDAGLTSSTSYSYRVRASDTAGTSGPYSNVATATTVAPTITAPVLSATAAGTTQINLSWTAATESGGSVSQYLIERCQGAGCGSFAQIATAAAPAGSYTDAAVSASTSYSYRVRAQDGTGLNGPYSNTATAATGAAVPTAPAGLGASALSSTQVNLSWAQATESGGTIAQYLIERCQGASCSSFAQVGTATMLSFADTGLIGATAYSYRVRAKDALGTTGPYSNIATATTTAPSITAPASLSATAASSTQINLQWPAATETGGSISQYLIERCQGTGCSTFAQVATAAGTTYNDAGLSAATSYTYRVRATDGGNTGPYSPLASATTAAGGGGGSPGPITYLQSGYATPQTPQSTVSVKFAAAQVAGDLAVVVVGWNDSTATVGSVTDSSGNTYRLAVGPTVQAGTASQSIYYASNIVAAAAGANTVKVTFTSPAVYADVRILEYGGIDPNDPLDVIASGSGTGSTSSTAPVTTTYANDLIIGANLTQSMTVGPGAGFTTRLITSPDGDMVEDRIVTATGSYSASASVAGQPWIMQLAAFRRHP